MRNMLLLIVMALELMAVAVAAQDVSASVAGRVLLAADGTPLVAASVIVQNPVTGQMVSGTLSGNDGRFVVRGLPAASYSIRVSFPGFVEARSELLVSSLNASYDLGDIRLRLENVTEEVTVTTDAIRVAGLDTQLFRLADGPTPSTGTLLDALKSVPGVTIDQEGRVSLRGSDQVAILIDGRQSSLTGFGSQRGLDSVSAANVEAIEIINNPSARFDAAGMAGIINIIYKQDQQRGFSGDIGLGLGMGQFTNEKIVPSFNLSHRADRVRSFIQGEVLFQDDLPNNEFTTRIYDDGRVIESQVPENREQYHYTIRGGVDWTFRNANSLSVSGVYDFERHVDRAQVPFILQSTGARERFWFWREQEDTGFTNVNATFKRPFGAPGHELDVNLQYTRGLEDEAYFLNEESPIRVGTDMTHLVAAEHTLPLSVDYTRPLRTGRLELGAKLQRRWIPVTYTVDRGQQSVIYEGLGDFSDWDESILAAYANLVRVASRYSIEAGLRLEDTSVSYTIPAENIYYDGSDTYGYLEVFPNARFTFNLTPTNRLVAAYNRRVDRPGEPELRIFPKYDDPELLKVGNPFLRPQFTNAYEVGISRSWTGGSASAAVYHRDITDAFLRVFAIDDSNPSYDIVNRIYENAGNSRQTGVQALIGHDVGTRWRLSGNVNWFRNEIDPLETTLLFPTRRAFALPGSNDHTWDLTVNNMVRLPRAIEVQGNYVYYAARSVPQGRQRARSSFDLAAKWPLMNDRAELVFSFTDVFNDFAVQHEIDGQGFRALYQNFLESQVATVGLRYRF
jgi:outer membrane receptor protein involved in Fe transport